MAVVQIWYLKLMIKELNDGADCSNDNGRDDNVRDEHCIMMQESNTKTMMVTTTMVILIRTMALVGTRTNQQSTTAG